MRIYGYNFGDSKKKVLQAKDVNPYLTRLNIVGLSGFEPPTPCPPDMYAKPLRYSPISNA